MEKILKLLVPLIMEALLEVLPKEKVVEAMDKALDKLEEKIEASETKLDDMVVLPLIKKLIREPFGIEDND